MRVARLATLALLFSHVGQETISIFIQFLEVGSVAPMRGLSYCCRLPSGLSTSDIRMFQQLTISAQSMSAPQLRPSYHWTC